jgi:hypothetical protein
MDVKQPLTLREENGSWMFENRILRRIYGPNSDEMTGEWRKLHEKLFHFCSSLITVLT